MSVEFEENQDLGQIPISETVQASIPKMSGFLIRIGLVRNADAAVIVLFSSSIIFAGIAVYLFAAKPFIPRPPERPEVEINTLKTPHASTNL